MIGKSRARILRVGVEHTLGRRNCIRQLSPARGSCNFLIYLAGAIVFDGFADSTTNGRALCRPFACGGALTLRSHLIVEVREHGLIQDRWVRFFHPANDFRQTAKHADLRTYQFQQAPDILVKIICVHALSPTSVEKAAAAAILAASSVCVAILKQAGHQGLRSTTCLVEVRSSRLKTIILPTAEAASTPDNDFIASRLTRPAAISTLLTKFSCRALSSRFLWSRKLSKANSSSGLPAQATLRIL